MKLIVTARELIERGLWEAYCEMTGLSEWAVNEGRMDSGDEVTLTEDQARELGLLPREGGRAVNITLEPTCYACPEQYDAKDETGRVVGYLRLRHGSFTVDAISEDGERTEVYSAHPDGDGIFDHAERDGYLAAAVRALRVHFDASLGVPDVIEGETAEDYRRRLLRYFADNYGVSAEAAGTAGTEGER